MEVDIYNINFGTEVFYCQQIALKIIKLSKCSRIIEMFINIKVLIGFLNLFVFFQEYGFLIGFWA